MTWIEIIRLRASDGAELDTLVDELAQTVLGENLEVTVLRSAKLPTDLSVHLLHETEGGATPDQALGLQLAETLTEHGLVHRSLWQRVHPHGRSDRQRRQS